MSVRSIRLCDIEPCQRPFYAACALCERDVCEAHHGSGIALHASIGSIAIGRVTTIENVCSSCIARFNDIRDDAANDALKTVIPEIKKVLRAEITAVALKG